MVSSRFWYKLSKAIGSVGNEINTDDEDTRFCCHLKRLMRISLSQVLAI